MDHAEPAVPPQTPGDPMPRPTASTINDDQLDALYVERDHWAAGNALATQQLIEKAATLNRVRHLAEYARDTTTSQPGEWAKGQYDLALAVLDALDSTAPATGSAGPVDGDTLRLRELPWTTAYVEDLEQARAERDRAMQRANRAEAEVARLGEQRTEWAKRADAEVLAHQQRAERAEAVLARAATEPGCRWPRCLPEREQRRIAGEVMAEMRGEPSVRQCATDDASHWSDKYAGELS